MGSWHGTDLLTQLPIRHGMPARLVFIAKQPYESRGDLAGFCYPTSIYSPVSLPILGEYDDYGKIEKIKDSPSHEHVLKMFNVLAVETDKFDKQKITLDYLMESAQDGRIAIQNDGKNAQVGYVLILEDIYQMIIKSKINTWRHKNLTADMFRKCAKKYYEFVVKDSKEVNYSDEALRRVMKKYRYCPDHSNVFYSSFQEGREFGLLSETGLRMLDNVIYDKLEAGQTVDSCTELANEMADFMFFGCCMAEARKHWHPQSGAGSQGDYLTIHTRLAEAVLEHAKQRDKDEA